MNKKGDFIMKKKSIGSHFSMCVQPTFIIGTYNENGSPNFAPITWISVTCENDDDYMLVISMYGTKKTKTNVAREKQLSVSLVSTDMISLVDYLGSMSGWKGEKNDLPYEFEEASTIHAPILCESRWVYECELSSIYNTGKSDTFFCKIKNVQIDERIEIDNHSTFDIDLTKFDPLIYSGQYHSVGKLLGKIGDFYKPNK